MVARMDDYEVLFKGSSADFQAAVECYLRWVFEHARAGGEASPQL